MNTRNLLPWLYPLVWSGYMLVSFLPELAGVDNRVLTVPYRAVTVAVSLLVIVGAHAGQTDRYRGAYVAPVILFWFLYFARLVHDTMLSPVELRRPVFEYYLYAGGTCVVPMFAFFACLDRRSLHRAYTRLLTLMLVICVVAILFAPSDLMAGKGRGRLWANEFLNPIQLGHQGASLVTMAVFALLRWRESTLVRRLGLSIALVVGLLIVGLSGSRAALMVLVVTIPLVFWGTLRGGGSLITLLVIVLGLGWLAPAILSELASSGSSMADRVITTRSAIESWDAPRLVLWGEAIESFLESPLVGYALELRSGAYPHNIVLEAFMATGIVGGSAILIVFWGGISAAVRLIGMGSAYAWIALLFVQATVGALFSGTLYTQYFFWCTLAGTLASLQVVNSTRRAALLGPE